MTQKNYQFHRFVVSIKRLTPMILILSHSPVNYTGPMVNLTVKLLKHHGEESTVKTLKSFRTYLSQTCLRQDVRPLVGRKVDKEGFPKVLKPWKKLTKGSVEDQRLLMSLWRVLDSFRLEPKYDFSTIESPCTADKTTIEEFNLWLRTWSGLRALRSEPEEARCIFSSKAGPNGPATAASMMDLVALRKDTGLYKDVDELGLSAGTYPLDDINVRQPDCKVKHSKLVALSDKAGKTRIIAIGDWWTNVALSGLHDTFMEGLSRLRSDLTYHQTNLKETISSFPKTLYSADMTAFTDRLPAQLCESVVSAAYGTTVGRLWRSVITKRVFESPKGLTSYACGNPMGLLSSWAISSFTHHAIKEWCAHLVGKDSKYKYLVLGDDSLDTDLTVYNKYIEVMTRLGLSISTSKCTQSEDGYTEFAKRYFTPDGEITGLPVDILSDVRSKPEQLLEIVRILRSRGYCDDAIIPGIKALIKDWKNQSLILKLLSAPEYILGAPTLIREDDTDGYHDMWSQVASLNDLYLIAKEEKFWGEVNKVVQPTLSQGEVPNPASRGVKEYEENPWVVLSLDGQRATYFHGEFYGDKYSTYHAWLEGKDRDKVVIPDPRPYYTKNRGHKLTKARWELLKFTLQLSEGKALLPFQPRHKVSNADLITLGFA